jgi:hypothetical protein
MSEREEYLGDGVYASFDGRQIRLRAPREDIDHEVFLEPSVLAEFLAWARRVGAIQEPGSPSGQDEEA